MFWSLALALVVLTLWIALWLVHAGFWRIDSDPLPSLPDRWPEVVAIIPARDEEEGVAETLHSLWDQGYEGRLRVVVVDDHSQDRTVERALQAAQDRGKRQELQIVSAEPLPPG